MKSLPDLLFGPKHHHYGHVAQHEENVIFSHLKGDRRYVLFTLKSIWKSRDKGPAWARKTEHVGYIVHWYTHVPVPIGNTKDGYKTVKAADFEVTGDYAHPQIWTAHVGSLLGGLIHKIRANNGFYWEGGEYYRANNE